jgi:hypothetical protein
MAKASAPDGNPIEKLLTERSQYLNWLARLDAAGEGGSSVPEAVRLRVRADYETRLIAVVDQLRAHATAITGQLEALHARQTDLSSREAVAKERMSEAEVRHAVGEYDEARWQEIRNEQTKVLGVTREELTRTVAEIERLTEVQALVNAPESVAAEPEPEEEPELPPPPLPAARVAAVPVPRAPTPPTDLPLLNFTPQAEAAHAAPSPSEQDLRRVSRAAPKKEEPPARTEWIPSEKPSGRPAAPKIDELAFLKSVAPEKGAAPKRSSGGVPRPPEVVSPPTPVVPERMASEPLQGITRADVFASKSGPAMSTEPPVAPSPGGKERPSQQAAPKTLKCGECGTLNRPTEWYCERCGAELAAL